MDDKKVSEREQSARREIATTAKCQKYVIKFISRRITLSQTESTELC